MTTNKFLMAVAVFGLLAAVTSSCNQNQAGKTAQEKDTLANGPKVAHESASHSHVTKTDTVEFFAFDDNGDDPFLSVVKGKDTVSYMANELSAPSFHQGDLLAVEWYEDDYTPAGDESVIEKRKFADKAKVIKTGPTGELVKRLKLEAKFYDDNLSGTSKDNLSKAMMNFLATTKEPRVRTVIDIANVKSVKYTVQQTQVNGKEIYEVMLGEPGKVFMVCYYHPEQPYRILTDEDL